MKNLILVLLLLISVETYSQKTFSKSELSINGFRSPSIGLEYRYNRVSVHAGYYLTAFDEGETTNFINAGLTLWFLPVGEKENPSSFFAGASYMRGLNYDYEDKNALGMEAGFRWMVWKGLNVRIGAIVVAADGESIKLNPAGGISYSFFFNQK